MDGASMAIDPLTAMPPTTVSQTSSVQPEQVVVHPLVLLSVVDHYQRAAGSAKKRVLGVLLGQWIGKTVQVTNSYALPFEEDAKDSNVWFIDHNYHETMCDLFKKVSARERPVGWYHTGPRLRPADLRIDEMFRRYMSNPPVLVVISAGGDSEDSGLPTEAYVAIEEIREGSSSAATPSSSDAAAGATTKVEIRRTFAHVASVVEAEEAEEIGVEHLLRDIRDQSHGTLGARLDRRGASLRGLAGQLASIQRYLQRVSSGELPINHQIGYLLQDILNLLPDMKEEVTRALTLKINDSLMMVYVGAVARSLFALHDLINNKLEEQRKTVATEKLQSEASEKNPAATGSAAPKKAEQDKMDVDQE